MNSDELSALEEAYDYMEVWVERLRVITPVFVSPDDAVTAIAKTIDISFNRDTTATLLAVALHMLMERHERPPAAGDAGPTPTQPPRPEARDQEQPDTRHQPV